MNRFTHTDRDGDEMIVSAYPDGDVVVTIYSPDASATGVIMPKQHVLHLAAYLAETLGMRLIGRDCPVLTNPCKEVKLPSDERLYDPEVYETRVPAGGFDG